MVAQLTTQTLKGVLIGLSMGCFIFMHTEIVSGDAMDALISCMFGTVSMMAITVVISDE